MDKFTKKLTRYGALTTAILAGLDASGQIIYTDENPDFVGALGDEYFLDFNNDGINELRLSMTSYTSSGYTYKSFELEPLNSAGFVASGFFPNPLALNNGDVISSGQNFGTSAGNGAFANSSYCFGDFCNVNDAFIGVRFDITGNTHYGWVRLDANLLLESLVVKDYAYESTVNGSIAAGDEGVVASVNIWDGMIWSLGAPPTNMQEVVINGDYDTSIQGSFVAQKLTINVNNILLIAPDTSVSVDNDIIVDGILNIAHTGSIVQVSDIASVTNNGTIDVALSTPNLDTGDFMILGSPMNNETREDVWASAFNVQNYTTSNFVPNVDVGASGVIYNFSSENVDDWNLFASGALTPGEGFLIFPQASLTAPGGIFNYNYNTGTLNNGIVSRPLVFNTNAADSPNMLSNPYASGIDATLFLAANPQIDAVYFWDHLTSPSSTTPGPYTNNYNMDDISVINNMGPLAAANGGTAPTGVIATAQGFGVFASALGTATFNNSMRTTTGNTSLRSNDLTSRNRFWLNVKNETYELGSNALVGFTPEATSGYDAGYDNPRLATVISLHSNLDDDLENGYAIQGREAFNVNMQIPFSFATDIDELSTYRISLSDFDGDAWETTDIYIVDNVIGVVTNLSKSDHVFTSDKGAFDGRFTVQFRNRTLETNDTTLLDIAFYPNPTNGLVTITSPNALISGINVTDIQGRVIENITVNSTNNYLLDMARLENAVYFVTVTTEAGFITKRIVKR